MMAEMANPGQPFKHSLKGGVFFQEGGLGVPGQTATAALEALVPVKGAWSLCQGLGHCVRGRATVLGGRVTVLGGRATVLETWSL